MRNPARGRSKNCRKTFFSIEKRCTAGIPVVVRSTHIYRSVYRQYTLGRNIFPNNFHGERMVEGGQVQRTVPHVLTKERHVYTYIYIYKWKRRVIGVCAFIYIYNITLVPEMNDVAPFYYVLIKIIIKSLFIYFYYYFR